VAVAAGVRAELEDDRVLAAGGNGDVAVEEDDGLVGPVDVHLEPSPPFGGHGLGSTARQQRHRRRARRAAAERERHERHAIEEAADRLGGGNAGEFEAGIHAGAQ
jgi:hypothetical protein